MLAITTTLALWGIPPAQATPMAAAAPGSAASTANEASPNGAGHEPGSAGAAPQRLPWEPGPRHVDLGHELSIDLSDHFMFLPREAAGQVLERMGSFHHEDVLGLATSVDPTANWVVVIRYEDEGYVKDDERIDAGELLSALREGNDEANTERKEHGFRPLALEGWAEAPHYDRARHQLVWALIVSDSEGKSVNYNTRMLGRRGFASLNLVTDPGQLDAFKPEASALLAATHFGGGARYEDFVAGSDKTAEYGLLGLIAAGAGIGAAKMIKIGLIAKFWKVLLAGLIAGKKAVLLALAAAGSYLKRLFGARKKNEAAG